MRRLLTLSGCVLVLACSPSQPAPTTSAQPEPGPTVEVAGAVSSGAPTSASPGDVPKPKKGPAVVGLLFLTKGAQPVIGGRLVGSDTMVKFFGEDWRDLRERRFRVYGEIHDHQCEPGAQCMMDGVIPLVRNVTSIELCQGCRKAPDGVQPVKCELTEEDKRSCTAKCEVRGNTCRERVAGNDKHVQRCDSQLAGCREGCQLHGVPAAHCD